MSKKLFRVVLLAVMVVMLSLTMVFAGCDMEIDEVPMDEPPMDDPMQP